MLVFHFRRPQLFPFLKREYLQVEIFREDYGKPHRNLLR